MKIASIIPTYKRADKLPDFVANHNECSTQSKLYFVISPDDPESKDVLDRLGEAYFIVDGEYVAAINHGFRFTDEDFVLCAADDVVFTSGWDAKILDQAKDETKHIFGGIDEWQISLTLKHISHPVVRRSHFIRENLYHPEYIHYMCDIEFEQKGMREGIVSIIPEILIEHPHTVSETIEQKDWDETYKRSFSKIGHDHDLYHRRRAEFEMWDFDDLQKGYVTPTRSNPLYNETFLSIVIPSYKDYENIQKTLQSVVNNTYYRFEIIIINDGPESEILDSWTIVNRRKFFDSIQMQDRSCEIRVVHNEKQEWVNYNWNLGAKMAKGQYVTFLNSDITLSQDWDKYLVAVLENPAKKFTIACPFETNPHTKLAYSLDKIFIRFCPNMIKGQCFMMRKTDADKIFPIPEQIKHWCGDNYIADRAEAMNKTVFCKQAVVHHLISQSSNQVKSSVLQKRIYTDILEYEKLSGRNMEFIKRKFPQVIRDYCLVSEDEYKNLQTNSDSHQKAPIERLPSKQSNLLKVDLVWNNDKLDSTRSY